MKPSFKNLTLIATLMAVLAVGGSACKTPKKVTEDPNAKAEQEARLAKEREEQQRREEEERKRKEAEEKERKHKEALGKLDKMFNDVANASSVDQANQLITQALSMFGSPETPVLIVIHKSGEMKDYDRPTTIKKYLEYLKDQKKSPNAVSNIVYDGQGNIKEVELLKKY